MANITFAISQLAMMAIDESFENIKAAIEIAEKELGLTTYDQHQTFLMTMAGLQ